MVESERPEHSDSSPDSEVRELRVRLRFVEKEQTEMRAKVARLESTEMRVDSLASVLHEVKSTQGDTKAERIRNLEAELASEKQKEKDRLQEKLRDQVDVKRSVVAVIVGAVATVVVTYIKDHWHY